ncbi:MAG TPA: hypothetical protein VJT75_00655 [Thermoleophilaceae bacterium]|nr:hypothetical protein [Thermoleophilaceae bacterium]
MSTLAVIIVVISVLAVIFFIGGFIAVRRRAARPEVEEHIRHADRALEQARAKDRGWHRESMLGVASEALRERHPDHEWPAVELVLVEDRPGVTEDRAHMVCAGPQGPVRVILARREGGEWFAEQVEPA